jgi:hypothetical protein
MSQSIGNYSARVCVWPRNPLRNLAPRLGVPGLAAFRGVFVDLLSKSLKYLWRTIDLRGGARVAQPPPASFSSLQRPRGISM